jgi:hypothetical protein
MSELILKKKNPFAVFHVRIFSRQLRFFSTVSISFSRE